MRSERRRRRRERDEESGGAARGAVGPGRSSRRRRGVVVPILHEDCVEDCRVFAVVREAYVVPRDRPFKSQYTVVAPFLAAALGEASTTDAPTPGSDGADGRSHAVMLWTAVFLLLF